MITLVLSMWLAVGLTWLYQTLVDVARDHKDGKL